MRNQRKSILKASLCRWGESSSPYRSAIAALFSISQSLVSPLWPTARAQWAPAAWARLCLPSLSQLGHASPVAAAACVLHPSWASSPSAAQWCSLLPAGTPKISQAKSLSLESTVKGHWAPQGWKWPLLWLLALQPLPVGSTGPLAAEGSWYTKLC